MKSSLIVVALVIAAVASAAVFTGCAGLTLTASSPWGDVSSQNGTTYIAPRPVLIPISGDK